MVKTPRHSKSKPATVTIDLDKNDVKKHDDNPQSTGTSGSASSGDAKGGVATAKPATKAPSSSPKSGTPKTSTARSSATKPASTKPNATKPDNTPTDKPAAGSQNGPESKSTAKSAAPVKKQSTGSAIIPGLIGAVWALLGAAGLQWAGILPALSPDNGSDIAVIEERLATLDTSVSQLIDQPAQTGNSEQTTALETRIDGLESLLQTDSANSLTTLSELNIRLDQLTSKIINVETAVEEQNTSFNDQIKQLSVPSEGGEEGVSTLDSVALNSLNLRLDQITSELTQIDQSIDDKIANVANSAPSAAPSDQTIAQYEELLALSQQQQTNIADLTAQLNALENTNAGDADVSSLITQLEARLAEAESKIANPPIDNSVARSLAAINVKSAIDRGGKFIAQLNAFAEVDPEHSAIQELRPIARNGVLTRADLNASFSDIANQIISADLQSSDDGNIMSRLLTSATSMVSVRKVGDIEGEGTEAIVARIETRLQDGELQAAYDEWSNLSDKAKSASTGFSQHLQNLIKAEKLATSLLQASPSSAS